MMILRFIIIQSQRISIQDKLLRRKRPALKLFRVGLLVFSYKIQ